MLTQKTPKNPKDFFCKNCDFISSNKKDYDRHLATDKHKMLTNVDKKTPKNPKPFQCECGKQYKHRQSLSVHKKKCKIKNNEILEKMVENKTINEKDMMSVPKEMWERVMNHMDKQQEALVCLSSKSSKTINNNFNIQIFLNENCKDALSITEFVDSLQLKLEDLLYSKQNGAIEGISNVIIKGLNELDIEKRPLHCTDIKRETLYIKDENGWEKENKDKEKLKKAIFTTQQRQARLIHDWQKENPDWADSMAKMEEFHQFVQKIYMDDGEENKVIKNIAKQVQIDKC
tara:strand:+ start:202 stop:1065 length:864 start_codon:yes stop_codon:yes gene_type:complete